MYQISLKDFKHFYTDIEDKSPYFHLTLASLHFLFDPNITQIEQITPQYLASFQDFEFIYLKLFQKKQIIDKFRLIIARNYWARTILHKVEKNTKIKLLNEILADEINKYDFFLKKKDDKKDKSPIQKKSSFSTKKISNHVKISQSPKLRKIIYESKINHNGKKQSQAQKQTVSPPLNKHFKSLEHKQEKTQKETTYTVKIVADELIQKKNQKLRRNMVYTMNLDQNPLTKRKQKEQDNQIPEHSPTKNKQFEYSQNASMLSQKPKNNKNTTSKNIQIVEKPQNMEKEEVKTKTKLKNANSIEDKSPKQVQKESSYRKQDQEDEKINKKISQAEIQKPKINEHKKSEVQSEGTIKQVVETKPSLKEIQNKDMASYLKKDTTIKILMQLDDWQHKIQQQKPDNQEFHNLNEKQINIVLKEIKQEYNKEEDRILINVNTEEQQPAQVDINTKKEENQQLSEDKPRNEKNEQVNEHIMDSSEQVDENHKQEDQDIENQKQIHEDDNRKEEKNEQSVLDNINTLKQENGQVDTNTNLQIDQANNHEQIEQQEQDQQSEQAQKPLIQSQNWSLGKTVRVSSKIQVNLVLLIYQTENARKTEYHFIRNQKRSKERPY